MKKDNVAFIFDLDGVLVDTAIYHYKAWKEIASQLDFELTEDQNESLKGVGRSACLDIILDMAKITTLSEKEKSKLLVEKNDLYLEYISSLSSSNILDGVDDFINKLKPLGIPMAIGSASKNAKRILDAIGLKENFNVIIDGTHVSKSKPDPEVFLLGSDTLKVAPQHCIVVEDSLSGIKAAKTAGMHTIAIGDNPALAIADIQINNLSELTEEQFELLVNNHAETKNRYLKIDPWRIIEDAFEPSKAEASESIFSIGNGSMGQRANFEEDYSGPSLQGSYIGGIYYPDRTRVGWWKNGYPEYFAKVLNAPNWIGIHVYVNEELLDLHTCKSVTDFRRVLDMQKGILTRSFIAYLHNGIKIKVTSTRLISMHHVEVGAIHYFVTPINSDCNIRLISYIDGGIHNQDSNWADNFWRINNSYIQDEKGWIDMKTNKTKFYVTTAMNNEGFINGKRVSPTSFSEINDKEIGCTYQGNIKPGQSIELYKFAGYFTSLNHNREELSSIATASLEHVAKRGFQSLVKEQEQAWQEIWEQADIEIHGDDAAQQGIRFNIFQLNQTYSGKDTRLNIGPKGFTGEKYGGSTYWDTEAYCLPFYMLTKGADVARGLLEYRYLHLPKAIENAKKLGIGGGAALYPMVTMNGEECHNEWEITFEEIHRNGAIAYAIFNYTRYTADETYLQNHGIEVLIAIARYWIGRTSFSEVKKQYVFLGVTGPNEYENNVNNNFYTNYIAKWCLEYTLRNLEKIRASSSEKYTTLSEKLNLTDIEIQKMLEVSKNLYFPYSEANKVFLQQDGFLDKIIQPAKDISPTERPINQHWSWDRILRSCFIKQADVLQGMYFFEDDFKLDSLRRNFEFYEPLTVHESSLSPCVHAILAARLGKIEMAYDFYLRTSRLDLDDYNHEVNEGCHITSMAGTWMSIVEGFGGMKIKEGVLSFSPQLPDNWDSFSFKITYQSNRLKFVISQKESQLFLEKGEGFLCYVDNTLYSLDLENNYLKIAR